jgi:outer membrane protein OmpA-like peptidoglycan-associated protein
MRHHAGSEHILYGDSDILRPFIHVLGFALLATSLTACESMNNDKDVKVTQQPAVQPVLSDAAIQRTYSDVVNNTGNSSVQVFSLDAHDMSAPYVAEQTPAPVPQLPQGRGQQFGNNGNVQVFSLDDQNPSYNAGGFSAATPEGRGGVKGGIPPMIDGMTPMPGAGPLSQGSAYQDGVARIYFAHGAKGVSSAGKQVSAQIGQQCRSGGCGVVKVEGHASTRAVAKDEVQRRIINLKISMDRAMNVMRQLVRDGVPAGSIQVTAHGDRVPPVSIPGGDAEGAARRVEIMTGSAY